MNSFLLPQTLSYPFQNDQYYFDCIYKALDIYNKYEISIATGDLNVEEAETGF